jgi:hypothetical protein
MERTIIDALPLFIIIIIFLIEFFLLIFRVISCFPHSPKANRTIPLVLLNLLVITPNIIDWINRVIDLKNEELVRIDFGA